MIKLFFYFPYSTVDYFGFSFQQIGYYDLPAFIDYILDLTNQEKLFYVGHSQGTTSFFAFASTRLEYNEKIRLSVTLSPVAYVRQLPNPFILSLTAFISELLVSIIRI